jgi:phosphoenolpyruvate-protein kinase (PTS system EI component)
MRTQQRRPNFVTGHRVIAATCRATAGDPDAELRGQIALIESADPGPDWVFARGIVGLVTKFGGAASHMTVRCAALNVPAAIGCGALLYGALASAALGELECTNSIVRSAASTSR